MRSTKKSLWLLKEEYPQRLLCKKSCQLSSPLGKQAGGAGHIQVILPLVLTPSVFLGYLTQHEDQKTFSVVFPKWCCFVVQPSPAMFV